MYVSGELVSYDLDKDLINEGLNVQRLINYSVSHVEDISFNFLNELKKKIPDIVYIYSQNSAVSFLNLIKKYELRLFIHSISAHHSKATSIIGDALNEVSV